jgi:hypothetical protein
MYDGNIRYSLIAALISKQNQMFESPLEPETTTNYITKLSREHGYSQHQCFFGRTVIQAAAVLETNNFVYTGLTMRLLE